MTPILYVAGPYRGASKARIAQNISAARSVALEAARRGWMPLCPHMNTAHMEDDLQHADQFWLAGTMELMTRCDAVVLVPGWETSEGTRGEIAKADQLQIPVYRTLDAMPSAVEFIAWLHAFEARRA